MQQRNRFASVFARAKRGLSRLFFGTDKKALNRRKRRRLRLERRERRSAPAVKPVIRQRAKPIVPQSAESAARQPAPVKESAIPQKATAASDVWRPKVAQRPDYEGDYLAVWHKNTEFMKDPRFLAAYRRGLNSGHQFGSDVQLEWRAHVACWAATHGKSLPGDFVECGVNTGILSLAVCEYIDFNATGKNFWLFDTFAGIPESQGSEGETLRLRWENEQLYFDCWEIVQRNFADYPNAHLIRGMVPETLQQATIDKVCYLSIDMNIAAPERAAIEYFWPKLVSGAVVLLDDYGWRGFEEQKATMDEFAAQMGTEVLSLPTGQGLIIKL
jgi:O-methyltransferase